MENGKTHTAMACWMRGFVIVVVVLLSGSHFEKKQRSGSVRKVIKGEDEKTIAEKFSFI